jgi:hypothetical protein
MGRDRKRRAYVVVVAEDKGRQLFFGLFSLKMVFLT